MCFTNCGLWNQCSRSCGGGSRGQICESCVLRKRKWFWEDCNQHCYNGGRFYSGSCHCSPWRSGRCCENCYHKYIAHCQSGHKRCGGSPDNIKCTKCDDGYYSAGYGEGCKACSYIDMCSWRKCNTYWDTRCITCYDNNIFFKTTHGGSKCERMCASNKHYCWPGYCSNELTRGCSCAPHFKMIQHSGETSCQPNKLPSILTCGTVVVGPNIEKKQARSSTNSTECQYLTDMYGNFQPSYFKFDFGTEYTIDIRSYTKPPFIHESHFGITDFATSVVKLSVDGKILFQIKYFYLWWLINVMSYFPFFASKFEMRKHEGMTKYHFVVSSHFRLFA
ncbi:laminin subunit alpha-1-like [Ruditapes philippinarum]|uniref:laminin subunit alpha-1-like n=1 Tax=Ruditapes philippinarum TaxID=129788 RepID=UPI00295AC6DB|nr:laminin subunit alpha-1-like [Ruditapes philippinarum]